MVKKEPPAVVKKEPPAVKKEPVDPPPTKETAVMTDDLPSKKKPVLAAKAKKKKKVVRMKTDKGLLRISCDDPIDIKISTMPLVKDKTKFSKELKPGDYRVTLIKAGVRKAYDVSLVPADPVVIRCPF